MEEYPQYKSVTRYICQDCGMEVASTKTHNDFHEFRKGIEEGDLAEEQEKSTRAQAAMGRFPQTSQLRSDGEWPR